MDDGGTIFRFSAVIHLDTVATVFLRTDLFRALALGCLDGQYGPLTVWASLLHRLIPQGVITGWIFRTGIEYLATA